MWLSRLIRPLQINLIPNLAVRVKSLVFKEFFEQRVADISQVPPTSLADATFISSSP